MGTEIEIITDERRLRPGKSEVERLWASNDRAHALLNWQPDYAGLQGLNRGLARTIEWFRQSPNLMRYKANDYNL